MAWQLHYHPFSSYSQKALIAFYEYGLAFEPRRLEDAGALDELARLWPMKRFPVLVDGDRSIVEASCVVEYISLGRPPGERLIPDDPLQALEVRMLDRIFDNYVSTPQQKFVYDMLRPQDQRDPYGVAEAGRQLDTAYAWLDRHLAQREWAAAGRFSLADCGAAPFLFYAHWTHPIPPEHRHLLAYRQRLLARPSVKRAVDEARPYRHLFPLPGAAPD